MIQLHHVCILLQRLLHSVKPACYAERPFYMAGYMALSHSLQQCYMLLHPFMHGLQAWLRSCYSSLLHTGYSSYVPFYR